MRVLLVNSVCYGSTGSIAGGVGHILAGAGHEALLCYGRGNPPGETPGFRLESGAEVAAHVLVARLADGMGYGSRSATKRLIAKIEAFRPDVIHLHNIHGYYLDIRLLFPYLKRAGIPLVWTLHDCWAFTGHCAYFDREGCARWQTGCGACPRDRGEYPALWGPDRSRENYETKRALFTGLPNLTLVSPSRWLCGLVKASFLSGYPVEVLPNGIDLALFRPTPSDIRDRHGLSGKWLILGVANVWEPRKNLPAFYELRRLLPQTDAIVLIGLTERQISALPDGVLGLPRTAGPEELAAWYTAADVFCDPTLEENFPTTHLEALACGTPVVTYDTGGSGEMLDRYCGEVVPTGDIAALAAAMDRAATLHREDCVLRASRYGRETRLAAYLDLYTELIHNHANEGEVRL